VGLWTAEDAGHMSRRAILFQKEMAAIDREFLYRQTNIIVGDRREINEADLIDPSKSPQSTWLGHECE
jgi:hypothetical protein